MFWNREARRQALKITKRKQLLHAYFDSNLEPHPTYWQRARDLLTMAFLGLPASSLYKTLLTMSSDYVNLSVCLPWSIILVVPLRLL